MKPLSRQTERIRWKDGKERELAEFMKASTGAGMSITEALKAFAEQNGISWLTARWKYYQMQRRGDGESRTRAAARRRVGATTAPAREGEFLETLRQFIGASKATGVDVLPLVRGLAQFASLAQEGARLKSKVEEAERERRALQEELERRRAERGEFEEHLRVLVRYAEEWLGKDEVERVERLPEFSEVLKRELSYVRRAIEPTA